MIPFEMGEVWEAEHTAVGEMQKPGRLGDQPYEIHFRGTWTPPIFWKTVTIAGLTTITFRLGDALEGSTRHDPLRWPERACVAQWGRPDLIVDLLYVGPDDASA